MRAQARSKSPRGNLLRLLGVTFGVAVGLGQVIGSGILRTPSLVAAEAPLAAAMLALWAFGAIHALLQANVLAELSTAIPRAGGQYIFAQRAFGDLGGLVVGWAMWCAHLVGLAASAIAFADFSSTLVPVAAGRAGAIAPLAILVLAAFNVAGLREGRALQIATTAMKVALLALFVCAALWVVPARISEPPHQSTPLALLALAGAYQLIRGAYNGWLAPVYFAEENVDPARSIPRSLFFTILATAVLYFGVNGALVSALGPHEMARGPLPYLSVLRHIDGSWPATLFVVGAMITALSCANASTMVAPRVLFALSRDRLLPGVFQSVNAGGSPPLGFVLTALAATLLAMTGAFRLVFGMIAILATLACLVTNIAYFVLRAREPKLARPFTAWLHPWLPGAAIVLDASLLVSFVLVDPRGAALAAFLCALCLPFALIVKRWRTS